MLHATPTPEPAGHTTEEHRNMPTATARGPSTRNKIAGKVGGVDAVEIKATIPDYQVEAALKRYGLTIDNDEERDIYFFDTPGLDLFSAGMVARARRIVGGAHDSTVKFRPAVPSEIPEHWRALDGFKLEADASETDIIRSASLTMPVEKGLIKQVVAGEKAIAKLFRKEQEDFLASIGERHIDYAALAIFGPLNAHRWKFEDPGCPWCMTAELWKRRDGARLLEVAIKTPATQAAAAIGGFLAFLAEVGVERDLAQQTKTRWALEYHANLLSRP
jgi:hypothetical protein